MGGKKRKRDEDRTSDRENSGSLVVVLDDEAEAPFCDHGPTVLFRRESKDASKLFYACSAYRDRKVTISSCFPLGYNNWALREKPFT